MNINDPEREDLKREIERFKKELGSTWFRVFSGFLFIVSTVLTVYLVISGERPEVFFPVHLGGEAVLWVISFSTVFWSAALITGWMMKRKKQE